MKRPALDIGVRAGLRVRAGSVSARWAALRTIGGTRSVLGRRTMRGLQLHAYYDHRCRCCTSSVMIEPGIYDWLRRRRIAFG